MPHTPRRSLRSAVGRTVFDCRAVCCRAPGAGACSLPCAPALTPGSTQLWPAPGSRTRLPIAAAFFFLLKKRKVIPAGPRQGWAPAPSPLHAMGPPLTWPGSARIEEAREGGRKPQMPQQPAASRPGAVQHVLLPGARAGTGAQGGAQAPAGAPLQHTALRKKPQERFFLFSPPRHNPTGTLRAQERQNHADRSGSRRNPGRRQ